MLLSKQISIDQSSCNKITFHQVHLQSLLHILFIDLQFFFRKNGISDHSRTTGNKFGNMFAQAMQRDFCCFIMACLLR